MGGEVEALFGSPIYSSGEPGEVVPTSLDPPNYGMVPHVILYTLCPPQWILLRPIRQLVGESLWWMLLVWGNV